MRLPWCLTIALLIVSVKGTTEPTSIACAAVNATALRVTWTQASDASVAGYHVDLIRSDGIKEENGYSIELNDRTYESYTFYGLGKYATYTLNVHSYLTSGANSTDYTSTCQTDPYYPDAATFNLTCYGISYTEITCHWENITQVYWNGIAEGWQLQYSGYINDEFDFVNFTMDTLTYTISSLAFDTWYVIQIRLFNQFAFGPYTSDPAKTLGFPVVNETKTRYFCYEAVPGTLEFGWESMPCTIYVGIILGLLLLTILLIIICCCQCCCKSTPKSNNNMEVNIFNEADDKDDDYTESEDETDEESITESQTGCKSPLSDDESENDGKTPPPIIAAKMKKEKEENKSDVDSDASSSEDMKSEKDSTKDTDSNESDDESNMSDVKPDSVGNSKEKKVDSPIKTQKTKKILIRKSVVKTEAMSIVKSSDAKEAKSPDKKKPKVATSESKKKKKKSVDSDDDDSDTDYYEDWNPDALDNPDVNVQKVSNKLADGDLSEEENKMKNSKAARESKDKSKQSDARKSKKGSKSDEAVRKKSDKHESESRNSSNASADFDSESDYSTDSESEDNLKKKVSNKKNKGTKNKDLAINQDSEDEWGDTSLNSSENKNKKTDGKFGKSDIKDKSNNINDKFSDNSIKHLSNKATKPAMQGNAQVSNNHAVTDNGDWDEDDDGVANQYNSKYLNVMSKENAQLSETHHHTSVNPVYINYGNAAGSGGNAFPINHANNSFPINNTNQGPFSHQNAHTGTNYGAANHGKNRLPFYQGHTENQGANQSNQHGYNSGTAGNTTPPGYMRGIGGVYHKAKGNRESKIPQGFIQNTDGSIYRDPSVSGPYNGNMGFNPNTNLSYISQLGTGSMANLIMNNPENSPPDGYKINPNGTYSKLPGVSSSTVPKGYSRNPDGSLHKINGQLPPGGYGYKSDGSLYRLSGNKNQNAPSGYVKNKNGTFNKLNGNVGFQNQGNNIDAPHGGQNLSNANPTQNNGYGINQDFQNPYGISNGQGQYFPINQNSNQALQNSENVTGHFSNRNDLNASWPNGGHDSYQQQRGGDRQKFNNLFEAKKRKRPLRRQTINGNSAINNNDLQANGAQIYGHGYGDGDNIFATKGDTTNSAGDGTNQRVGNVLGNSDNLHLNSKTNNHSMGMFTNNGTRNGNQQGSSQHPSSSFNTGQTNQQHDTDPTTLPNNRHRLHGDSSNNNGSNDLNRIHGKGTNQYGQGHNFDKKSSSYNASRPGHGQDLSNSNNKRDNEKLGFGYNHDNKNSGVISGPDQGYIASTSNTANAINNGNGQSMTGYGNGHPQQDLSNGQLKTGLNDGASKSFRKGSENDPSKQGHHNGLTNPEYQNGISSQGYGNNQTNKSNKNGSFNQGYGNISFNSDNDNGLSHQGNNPSKFGYGNDRSNTEKLNGPSNHVNNKAETGFGSGPSKLGNGYNPSNQRNGNNVPNQNGGNDLPNNRSRKDPNNQSFGNNFENDQTNALYGIDPSKPGLGNLPSQQGIGSDSFKPGFGNDPSNSHSRHDNGDNTARSNNVKPTRPRVGFRKVDSAQSKSRKNSDPFGIRKDDRNSLNPTNANDSTNSGNDKQGQKGLPGNHLGKGSNAWVVNENVPKEKRKGGTKTPVKELTLADKVPAKEAEPVTEIDRLGKKFPFLRFNNNGSEDKETGSDRKPVSGSNQSNPMRKNTSDTNLAFSGPIMGGNNDSKEFPSLPNTLATSKKHFSSNDLESLNPETRKQIFYGFGVGRWRIMAAKWLNKWKMKKRPVKTARSSWD